MAETPRVCILRTITTVRPQYFSPAFSAEIEYFDNTLSLEASSIDIGALFWNRTFQQSELLQALDLDPEPELTRREFGLAAIAALDEARSILGRASVRLPQAPEMLFCYRVILECSRIASFAQKGYKVHIARGLVALECDQHDLSSILALADRVSESAIGRLFDKLLSQVKFPASGFDVAVINLRNDGELYQAIALAAWLKAKFPKTILLLDAAGGNEQYNFGEWVSTFRKHAEPLGRYLDYFLPRQDYHASLKSLLYALQNGCDTSGLDKRNIVTITGKDEAFPGSTISASIEDAFDHYAATQPVFYAGGRRTILTRLSPDKCHWAACKFCTINTQHLMPRGRAQVDENIERRIELLVNTIKAKRVQSVILTDEALHPNVLVECARRLLDADVRVLVRARARFTNDLTLEACRLLYEAGFRFLGLGLESASQRVNALFEKHMGAPIDYERVLANFDTAGINAHIYAILGFPTESQEEISTTRIFLLKAIRNHRYVTVSANTFYLMRGSRAAMDPQSVGITQIRERGDVGLTLEFEETNTNGKLAFAERSANEIFEEEFMPGSEEPYMARGFWSFIDQSGLFYSEKIEYSENPYRMLARSRTKHLGPNYASNFFTRSRVFRVSTLDGAGQVVFSDWVGGECARVPSCLTDLIERYDASRSLGANVEALVERTHQDVALRMFADLYAHGFFRERHTEPRNVQEPSVVTAKSV